MTKPPLVSLLFILALLCGCTPLSENIARKADPEGKSTTDTVTVPGISTDGIPVLDASTQSFIRKYGPAIKRYSERYRFDWRLVLAVVKQESHFSHDAESARGAAGFMQIMPVTGVELADILDLADLSHPQDNIQGGIYYLKILYDFFEGASEADRLKLTLASYNAGISRVYDAQEVAAYLHENPVEWQSVKDALPLLSKRYYTLHRSIWGQDKPKSGWFRNSGETLKYVDAVMNYYDEFRLVLN